MSQTTSGLRAHYDVVIVGGAMIGSSIAWYLKGHANFSGHVLVVEKNPAYDQCSSAHTNSCIRQQFSSPINIQMSQYGVEAIRNFRDLLGGDPEIPKIKLDDYGYMFLAANEQVADELRRRQEVQAAFGVQTRLMDVDTIAREYPFYQLDDILLGSHNPADEGYFDGATMFDCWRRQAIALGVHTLKGEVVGLDRQGPRIDSVTLADGTSIGCGVVVNASGPRAAFTAAMAGLELPIEPRKRYSFVFSAEDTLSRQLPLTIDHTGIHMRSDGRNYLCGCPPLVDEPVAFDDFEMDHEVFEERVWPALAARVPAFERIKLINAWAGHYAYNLLDHNAILGPHPEISNLVLANGFSGHGFQQAAAVGRGMSEWITFGSYRSLDLSPLHVDRFAKQAPIIEAAVI